MRLNELLAGLPGGARLDPSLDLRAVLAMGGQGRGGVLYCEIPLHSGATVEEVSGWLATLYWNEREARLNGRAIEVYDRAGTGNPWWAILTLAS